MIKVNYDQNTNLVSGYYPDSIKYNSIPEPFIEIQDYEQVLDKTMCIVDGVYQEYTKSDSELLQEAKTSKIAQIHSERKEFLYLPITYNGSTFVNSEVSSSNLQGAYTFIDEPIDWLNIDGNTVSLTKEGIRELALLLISHRSFAYFQEANLINKIKACETIEEINKINITFIKNQK